jgi:N-methylhydantoinase B
VILANCRIPEQNWGDLQLLAGLTTGERRLHELIRRFGPDTVDKAMDDLIDYAARKVEALIRRMPAGRYEFVDYIEDDVVSDIPIRLKVALTIDGGEIHLDFIGSDVQVASALNVPTAGRVHPFMSVALVNYFATRDRTIPLNAGVLRRVRMTLPEGSVVNPRFLAACGTPPCCASTTRCSARWPARAPSTSPPPAAARAAWSRCRCPTPRPAAAT